MKLPTLDWKQVAALAVLVAGAVAVTVFAPSEYRAPVVGLLVAAAGWLKSPSSSN
jgi:hypothetical protein